MSERHQNRRPPRQERKSQSLPDAARDSALDTAAAALAAIHLAKQVRAESQAESTDCGKPGLLAGNLRLPLGDVLFGVAQLQIDFAKKLFEFNRHASQQLRQRFRQAQHHKRTPLSRTIIEGEAASFCFTIRNSAALSRTFAIRIVLPDAGRDWKATMTHEGVSVGRDAALHITVAAEDCTEAISAELLSLPVGRHEGYFEASSHNIVVERIHFIIDVDPRPTATRHRGDE